MKYQEKLERELNKFDYKYTYLKDKITIKIGMSHNVIIDFSKPDKIIITNQLQGWNFLTGTLRMNLKSAVIYNFVLTIILMLLCFYQNNYIPDFNFTSIFIGFGIWVMLFTIFYTVRYENFKTFIRQITAD